MIRISLLLLLLACSEFSAAQLPLPKVAVTTISPVLLQIQLSSSLQNDRILEVRLTDPGIQSEPNADAFGYPETLGEYAFDRKNRSWREVKPDHDYIIQSRWHKLVRSESTPISEWSEALSLRTPAPPASAPATPSKLRAIVTSPFSVTLRWAAQSHNEYGFEIRECSKKSECTRLGVTLPWQTKFSAHMLQPAHFYRFDVRAFNPAGVSPPSKQTGARTAIAWEPKGKVSSYPDASCTSRQTVLRGVVDEVATLSEKRIALPGRKFGDVFNIGSPDCHRAGCADRLYGAYGGCYRLLGELKSIFGSDQMGWPLLFSSYSGSAGSGTMLLIQPSSRGPVLVDIAEYDFDADVLEEINVPVGDYSWFSPARKPSNHFPEVREF